MSQERELKFRLDPSLHDAVRAHPVLACLAPPPQLLPLQSWYFDTPDHALHQAGLALRVRHTGEGQRILTLKSSPAQGLQLVRGEWEFAIDTDAPDAAALARLHATPLAALGDAAALAARVRPVLGTRMLRTLWRVDWQGTQLDVCLDHGQALGGAGPDAPSLPLSELEVELIDGHWQHAFDLAWALAQDLPLLLSPINKVQTAARAAGLAPLTLPTLARELAPQAHGGQAVSDALQQATAVLAVGAELLHLEARAETIHQMRLQLRRLRVLLHLLQTTGPASERAACRWLRGEWRWAGQLLGHVRDVDVCLDHAASLDPTDAAPSRVQHDLQDKRARQLQPLLAYLRSPRFGRALLAQARWADDWANGRVTTPGESADRLARRLLRFHRNDLHLHPQRWAELLTIWDSLATSPLEAPWSALHTLRLKAKQLRYALEWFAPWVDSMLGAEGKAWLKLTSTLQSDLGEALDTLRLARWIQASAPEQGEAGARQAFDQARAGLSRALQAARNAA